MIGGISGAFGGMSLAAARFDRAATQVSASAESMADPASAGVDIGGMGDAMVQMAIARFAMLASLHVAVTSNEMVRQALELGGHTAPRG
jgi:hypothetical protein